MPNGSETDASSEAARLRLTATVEALHAQHVKARDACAGSLQRATEVRREAARQRAWAEGLRRAVLRVRLPRAPTCGGVGRRVLEEYLAGCSDEVVRDAKMVASELINNAYRHGEGVIELRVRRLDDRIEIDVADQGEASVAQLPRGKRRRGFEVVSALSSGWGAYSGSTRVWAEIPLMAPVDACFSW